MENIYLQGRFYHLSKREILQRSTEILKMFDLYDRRNDLTATFSGGMLKRLDIAEALIHRPQILFLDEPTLGLDVQTRKVIWEYIKRLREEQGMTIFLTIHYMEEADALCDRGKIKALEAIRGLPQVRGIEPKQKGTYWIVVSQDGDKLIPEIFSLSAQAGVSLESISLKKPSLDDVYLHFTGREIRAEEVSLEAHIKARIRMGRIRRG